jgi:hypothetical protein
VPLCCLFAKEGKDDERQQDEQHDANESASAHTFGWF